MSKLTPLTIALRERLFHAASLISLFLLLTVALTAVPAHATSHCQFVLGFKTLRDLIGHDIVGECLEDQRYTANGNSEQQTTGGLLVWRKADNWTAFTDGYRTWVSGPNGLQQRLNTERFPWEADPTSPSAAPALTRDALRNAEYQHYEERVRLKNGLLVRKVSWSDHVSEAWQLHDPIAFGDLDSDGVEDAVVVLSYTGGGSGTFYNLLAVLNDNGAPAHVASYSIGDRIRLNALAIAAGVITVKMTAHDSDDAACCPTQDTVATFRLNGNALEFLSEVPPGNLTAAAQRAARPTVDPARIDPGLAEAFQEMRNAYAEEIDELYDWFVASGARARFGPLGESISQFNSSSNLITINEEYRNESPDALAHALIWPLASLHAISERGGSPQSWDQCIADRLAAHSAQAAWWLRYGVYGKQKPTQLEQWANNNLARSYVDKSLGAWVREAYRESCASYGNPPPLPTPTPTQAGVCPSAAEREYLNTFATRFVATGNSYEETFTAINNALLDGTPYARMPGAMERLRLFGVEIYNLVVGLPRAPTVRMQRLHDLTVRLNNAIQSSYAEYVKLITNPNVGYLLYTAAVPVIASDAGTAMSDAIHGTTDSPGITKYHDALIERFRAAGCAW